jgi:hypothetical protein
MGSAARRGCLVFATLGLGMILGACGEESDRASDERRRKQL